MQPETKLVLPTGDAAALAAEWVAADPSANQASTSWIPWSG
jgi:hypothetical protein